VHLLRTDVNPSVPRVDGSSVGRFETSQIPITYQKTFPDEIASMPLAQRLHSTLENPGLCPASLGVRPENIKDGEIAPVSKSHTFSVGPCANSFKTNWSSGRCGKSTHSAADLFVQRLPEFLTEFRHAHKRSDRILYRILRRCRGIQRTEVEFCGLKVLE